MFVRYNHFRCINITVRPTVATILLLYTTSAHAQLPSISDLLNSINILNAQVADHSTAILALDVDLDALNTQTTINTSAVAQLNYDLSAVSAQLAANGTVVTALDGRLGTVEGMLPPIVARTTALEASVAGQAAATALNTAAIGANAAVGTANTAAINANVLRDDGQDVAIAANVAVGNANTAAIAVTTTGLAANVLRDDAQDLALTANAAVGTANTAAIAANVLRDDGQDVAIAANAAVGTSNAAAISTLDGRVTAHDVVLAQHTTDIAVATQTAVAAQTATATLRSDVVAGRIGLVQQTPAGVITVGAQTGGTELSLAGTAGNRRISGVADGVGPSDAATVGQVAQSQAQAVSVANAYTDQTLANIVGRYDDHTQSLIAQNNTVLRREMNAAAASTAAISSLPHSINPGEGMGAIGIGGRGDAVAFAIGVSKAFKVDHTPVVRAGAALDARTGTLSYNASVGVHF